MKRASAPIYFAQFQDEVKGATPAITGAFFRDKDQVLVKVGEKLCT